MVGDKTDGEKYDENHNQFQTALLQHRIHVGFFGQNHNNVAVARQNDEQGYSEPSDGPADAIRQVVSDQLIWRRVEARLYWAWTILVKEHIRQDLTKDKNPHHGAYTHRVAAGDLSHHFHGVHDAQIPVHTDACEKADAAIEVQVEAEARHLAERLTELPPAFTQVVIHQEGQGEEVEQVGHPQVEHEDVDVSNVIPAVEHAPQSPDVGKGPDDKHGDEHWRQNGVREIQVDAAARKLFCVVLRHFLSFSSGFSSVQHPLY